MDLAMTGKKAIVTGASEGIGKAITHVLAREGVDVAICARRKEPLEATAAEIAKETGKSVTQIALNWLLQRPTVSSVIIGARTETQLHENLGAVGWSLTKEQVARLDEASKVTLPYPYWHQRSTFIERNPPAV